MSIIGEKSPLRFWRRASESHEAVQETVVTSAPAQATLHVVLMIGNIPARPLAVEVTNRLVLGRGNPADDDGPDVDLTAFGGEQLGVSRRHAALVHQDGKLLVEDLSSMNGTRLNGLPLGRGARFRLRNNDELELGDLRIVVRSLPKPR